MSTPIFAGQGPNPPGSKVYRILREFSSLVVSHFDGKLPDDLAQRIAAGSSTGFPYTTGGVPTSPLGYDIAAGIAHGYAQRPEIIDSWTGSGFQSLVDHAVIVGGFPVAVPLFGLDEEVAGAIAMRSIEDMAGAARLAVKNATLADIPAYSGGAKFPAAAAPALRANLTIRKSLLFAAFPQFVPLIELMGDVDVDVMHASLQRIRGTRNGEMSLGYIAALMVRAAQEKLPLDECLRVWSLVPGEMELVLTAVRDGIPDEYLLQLHPTGVDSSTAVR